MDEKYKIEEVNSFEEAFVSLRKIDEENKKMKMFLQQIPEEKWTDGMRNLNSKLDLIIGQLQKG